MGSVKVFHSSRVSLGMLVRRRVKMGQGRSLIGCDFVGTVAHSLFRVIPFVG